MAVIAELGKITQPRSTRCVVDDLPPTERRARLACQLRLRRGCPSSNIQANEFEPGPPSADLLARSGPGKRHLGWCGRCPGATVEFLTPREIRATFARDGGVHRQMIGGGWLRLKPGGDRHSHRRWPSAMRSSPHRRIQVEDYWICCPRASTPGCAQSRWTIVANTVRRNRIEFRHRSKQRRRRRCPGDAGKRRRHAPARQCRCWSLASGPIGDGTGEPQVVTPGARDQHHNPVSDCGLRLPSPSAVAPRPASWSLAGEYPTGAASNPFIDAHPAFGSSIAAGAAKTSGWIVAHARARGYRAQL